MSELQPPEVQFLHAAIGWIELGLPAEADKELDRISGVLQQHPDVLEVRWQVCAALENWDQGLVVAEALLNQCPERDTGWVHRAYSLRRAKTGGLEKAWDALLPAFQKFPENPIIAYNLACYAAQFERLDEAWTWLQKAMKISQNQATIKNMALADEDLKLLWDRIRKL